MKKLGRGINKWDVCCLPECCPYKKIELNEIPGETNCVNSGGPDKENLRWVYETCDFAGKNYRDCPKYNGHSNRNI